MSAYHESMQLYLLALGCGEKLALLQLLAALALMAKWRRLLAASP